MSFWEFFLPYVGVVLAALAVGLWSGYRWGFADGAFEEGCARSGMPDGMKKQKEERP